MQTRKGLEGEIQMRIGPGGKEGPVVRYRKILAPLRIFLLANHITNHPVLDLYFSLSLIQLDTVTKLPSLPLPDLAVAGLMFTLQVMTITSKRYVSNRRYKVGKVPTR